MWWNVSRCTSTCWQHLLALLCNVMYRLLRVCGPCAATPPTHIASRRGRGPQSGMTAGMACMPHAAVAVPSTAPPPLHLRPPRHRMGASAHSPHVCRSPLACTRAVIRSTLFQKGHRGPGCRSPGVQAAGAQAASQGCTRVLFVVTTLALVLCLARNAAGQLPAVFQPLAPRMSPARRFFSMNRRWRACGRR